LFTTSDYLVDKRSDCYSLGVLLWEISTGKHPFSGCNGYAIISAIIDGKREKPSPNTPQEYIRLYEKCWDDEPENRPTASQVRMRLEKMRETNARPIQTNNNGEYFLYNSLLHDT